MSNRDTAATVDYHEATKHSERSTRTSRHFLDWESKPLPFKIYRDLEAIALPRSLPANDLPALQAIATPIAAPVAGAERRWTRCWSTASRPGRCRTRKSRAITACSSAMAGAARCRAARPGGTCTTITSGSARRAARTTSGIGRRCVRRTISAACTRGVGRIRIRGRASDGLCFELPLVTWPGERILR